MPHPQGVDAVATSPDGARMATGGRDGTTRLWDAQSGAHVVTLAGHRIDVLAVAFSPDGSQVATGSWDGTARVWDAQSGAHRATLHGHTGPVRAVGFSPDGRRLVTAGRDGSARVWSVTGDAPLWSSSGEVMDGSRGTSQGTPLVDARFTPDGQRVWTVGADDTVRVLDGATGQRLPDDRLVALLEGNPVTAVAVSPDGQRLVAAAKDGSVRAWDLRSGDTWATMRGHTAPVRMMAFSADGERLATASEDGTARVWDAASGEPHAVFVHQGAVTSVAFSNDGTHLLTAGGRDGARRWSLKPQRWLLWGCAVLEGRQGHSKTSAGVCARAGGDGDATSAEAEPVPDVAELPEAVVSTAPDVEMPETIVVEGVELVLIPGGTFMMGSPEGELGRYDDEGPQHAVTLAPFYMARTELTNAQYARYLEANPEVSKPPAWDDERFNHPQQPVVGLTWYEAKAYCEWAGLVLPTEAQWEYAARAGTTTRYWFGDDGHDMERFGCFWGISGSQGRMRVFSVGTLGVNPWGLSDVYGNVWEWVLDAYAPYTTSVRSGDGLRKQPVGDADRVIRGGSFGNVYNGDARSARSAYRYRYRPGDRDYDEGLRPAQGIP
ncbi:MAG: SUMF1/EgtB/PvdO family nonheme iron enzyme [Myxococcota bacterium]